MTSFSHLPVMTGYRAGITDDHAFLRKYREMTPLAVSPNGFPMALRHAAIEALTNPDTTRQLETESLQMQGITQGPIFELFENAMLFANGPVHVRRRGPIARTFAFKIMEAARAEVRALARELVAERMGRGSVDFLYEVAGEIPARVIASILGVPKEEIPEFRRLVYSVTRTFVLGLIREGRAEIERDLIALRREIERLIAEREAEPQPDFLTRYLADAKDRGDLTEDEVRWQVATLIVGGVDTTRLSLCAALSHLLQRPDQWGQLCADPDGLKKAAVQEALRFEPPIAAFARVALVDIDLGGLVLPAGAPCSISTLSAMRDEEIYARPDDFDLLREDHPKWHPVFGAGAHRCIGEALARVELEESLAAIAELAPRAQLANGPPTIYGVNGIRSIDRMEVTFAA